ncbi:MAG: hypothetical protein K6G85_05195 [Eubacterium sp.]|nr:hypothetical protein [Eubacterium sp.]
MRIKRIVIVVFILLMVFATLRPFWNKQFWPEGYYDNLSEYVELESSTYFNQKEMSEDKTEEESEELTLKEERSTEKVSEESTTQDNSSKKEPEEEITEKILGLDYYNQLNNQQKEVYRQIVNGCKKYQKKITVTPLSQKKFWTAYYAVSCDHPEFFWLNEKGVMIENYRNVKNQINGLEMNVGKDTKKQFQKIEKSADKILSEISEADSTYNQIKKIYNALLDLTEYKENSYDQDLRGPFIRHKTVCNGYAMAFAYLCKKRGINCSYAYGTVIREDKKELHAWNIVELDGKYYWIDATWGDDTDKNVRNYWYFLVPDKYFFEDHTLNYGVSFKEGEKKCFSFPECNDDSLYYFVKEGGLFEKFDKNQVKSFIYNKTDKKVVKKIAMKFTSKEALFQAEKYLIDENNLFNCLGKESAKLVKRYDCLDYSSSKILIFMLKT